MTDMDVVHDRHSLKGGECDEDKVEPGELLEEGWFFGKLFHTRKSKMSRSFSDPCSCSSNYGQDISNEETYASIKRLSECEEFERNGSSGEGKDQSPPMEGNRWSKKKSSNGLNRAPSLPINIEEFQDEEIEFSMGKLIRQASMNNTDVLSLPPRTHASAKGMMSSSNSSISRHRSRKKLDFESIKFDEIKPQNPTNQLKAQKSSSDLEYEELQGFKDLGFDFDKKGLSPNVISIIPGLQEKKRTEEKRIQRPYLSEVWKAQISAPPVPKWAGKRSTEDMKAQIKFWARAVASNVRQEC